MGDLAADTAALIGLGVALVLYGMTPSHSAFSERHLCIVTFRCLHRCILSMHLRASRETGQK